MKKYTDLIEEVRPQIKELFPWDLEEKFSNNEDLILLDIREPYEYSAMHIKGSINVPRGVLESACDWNYEETVPELAQARDKEIIIICRSGYRSVLAAYTMQLMGYKNPVSLNTGLRGWSDYEQPMVDDQGYEVDMEVADEYFESKVREDQLEPA